MFYGIFTSRRALPLAILVCGLLARAERASAQVVLSTGVQELYDDNIFLENDKGLPPPIVVDSSLSDPNVIIDPPKQVNGDPDSDFITNVFLSASGAIPLSEKVKTAAEGKIGALVFADESSQSRLTLDGTLTMSSEKTLIPDPFAVTLTNALQSRSSDITVADGTATKQAQTYLGSLNLGVHDVQLASATKLGAGYTFSYTDFLGDFTFDNSNNDDLGAFKDRVEPKGSDYITNAVDANIDQTLTENWVAGIYGGFSDVVFTHVETNDLVETTRKSQDREEGRTGLRSSYRLTEKLSAEGNVGLNLTHLKEKPDDVSYTIFASDGSQTTITKSGDQDDISLAFGGALNYSPEETSAIRLAVDQGQRTDVDGSRLITRSVSLDLSKGFGDRLKLTAGGRYLQYNVGSTLSKPSDRYEVTTSLQYSLTQSLALQAGWNYTKQNADEDNIEQRLLYTSEDYEANRFFVGLTAGLVGTKS